MLMSVPKDRVITFMNILEPPAHKYIQKQQTMFRQNTNEKYKYAYKHTHTQMLILIPTMCTRAPPWISQN